MCPRRSRPGRRAVRRPGAPRAPAGRGRARSWPPPGWCGDGEEGEQGEGGADEEGVAERVGRGALELVVEIGLEPIERGLVRGVDRGGLERGVQLGHLTLLVDEQVAESAGQ